MSSGITLSAGVRQNLLTLQNTADLIATTQNRLATGKRVNSALDNPSNFFTSQSLSNRATDLNSLLDSIGQATKTLDAANNGITSLTTLVQSAKSTAQQARQATAATSTYSAVDSSSNILSATNLNGSESVASKTGTPRNLEAAAIGITGATVTETLGRATGTAAFANDAAVASATAANAADGNLQITLSSRGGATKTYTVAVSGSINTKAGLLSAINGASDGTDTLNNYVTAAFDGSNQLQLTAKGSDVDFSISAGGSGSTAATLTALGLTTQTGAHDSTSLLDQLPSGASKTLTISGTNADASGFTTQTLTFGNGAGEVATLSDLNTKLAAAASASSGGFSASAASTTTGTSITGAISITKAAGTKSSVTVGGTVATNTVAAAALEGTAGTVFSLHNSQPTLADLGKSLGAGSGGPADLSSGGSLSVTINGTNFTLGIASTDRIDDVVAKLGSSSLASKLNFSKVTDGTNHDHIKIDAKDSSVDFTINANGASAALGLTSSTTAASTSNSTSLLDLLDVSFGGAAGSGIANGKTLTVAANGGSAQTITFGTGAGQIQSLDQLNTALGGLSGVTASVSAAGALAIGVASGSTATNLTIGGTAAAKLGLSAGTQNGTVISTTASTTRASLQSDFNNLLGQIDSLSKDASYNGINLLNGDDLKVNFNETGTSSLTISGVKFDSANLGLSRVNGTQFQDNSEIDSLVSKIDTALTSLRTQSSKFGSSLTTVQTRQDFTKNIINTLQTGSDALVLADTNEEGANLLALQTRQQLSTTSLSLANQASQAVLRLFG